MAPDEDKVTSAIVGIVDTAARSALLLRRFATDQDFPGQWCFPGGKARPGETTHHTAERETLEETGLTVHRLVKVGHRESTGATGRSYLVDCFVADAWSGSLITFPSAEHAAARWMPVESLPGLAPTGPTTRWLALEIKARFTSPEERAGASAADSAAAMPDRLAPDGDFGP